MRKKVWSNLYSDLIYLKPGKPKFTIEDKVRISKYKRQAFDKGYTPNWTEEIFVIAPAGISPRRRNPVEAL